MMPQAGCRQRPDRVCRHAKRADVGDAAEGVDREVWELGNSPGNIVNHVPDLCLRQGRWPLHVHDSALLLSERRSHPSILSNGEHACEHFGFTVSESLLGFAVNVHATGELAVLVLVLEARRGLVAAEHLDERLVLEVL